MTGSNIGTFIFECIFTALAGIGAFILILVMSLIAIGTITAGVMLSPIIIALVIIGYV